MFGGKTVRSPAVNVQPYETSALASFRRSGQIDMIKINTDDDHTSS